MAIINFFYGLTKWKSQKSHRGKTWFRDFLSTNRTAYAKSPDSAVHALANQNMNILTQGDIRLI